MAISFDESNDYYTIVDDASLSLPEADWCVGIWTKIDDNAGTAYQYLISFDMVSVNNSFNVWMQEAGAAGDTNDWQAHVQDGDGTGVRLVSATATGGDGLWRLLIIQRVTASSQVQLWHCLPGATATMEASGADTNLGIVNPGTFNIGRRSDANAARYYGSICAEFFKGNFSLSQSEIEALGSGLSPSGLGRQLDVYLTMFRADAILSDRWRDNDATRQDVPTTVAHPRMLYPAPPMALSVPVAAPAIRIPRYGFTNFQMPGVV